jgi:hypothetical protein
MGAYGKIHRPSLTRLLLLRLPGLLLLRQSLPLLLRQFLEHLLLKGHPLLHSDVTLIEPNQMGHQVDCLLLEVLAQFISDWVLQEVDTGHMGVYLLQLVQLGYLVLAETEVVEGGQEGEGTVDGFQLVVPH